MDTLLTLRSYLQHLSHSQICTHFNNTSGKDDCSECHLLIRTDRISNTLTHQWLCLRQFWGFGISPKVSLTQRLQGCKDQNTNLSSVGSHSIIWSADIWFLCMMLVQRLKSKTLRPQLKPLLEKDHAEKGPAVLPPLTLSARICNSPCCQPNNVHISNNSNNSTD